MYYIRKQEQAKDNRYPEYHAAGWPVCGKTEASKRGGFYYGDGII
jgi:hypothetical protein